MLGAGFALAAAAGLLFWLGLRLHRTGAPGSPERWLAVTFGALGCGMLPRLAAAQLLSGRDTGSLALALNALSHLAIEAGIVGLSLFTWRVFRPSSRAARGFVLATAAASSALTLLLIATAHADQEASGIALAVNATRAIPVLWAFAECTRYAQLMRRRVRLGLADPVVANRFVLWSVWTGALGVVALLLFAVRTRAFWLQAQGIDPRTVMPAVIPITGALAGLAVITAGVAIWLAFFPPAAYRRWLTPSAKSGDVL
jgi:hypothetical protein